MSRASLLTPSHQEMQAELKLELANLVPPGLALVGIILILAGEQWHWPWRVDIVALGLMIVPVLLWAVLSRAYFLVTWLLVLGSMAANVLALAWFPAPGLLSLLALPVAIAVLLISIPGGILMGLLATAIVIQSRQIIGGLGGYSLAPALLSIWGTLALMGASSFFSARTTESLWNSYQHMAHLLSEARNQRVELKQVQEDLVHANDELARLSERLKHMYQVAEDARRAKEEFVANVSHELRTPLNMIIGFSEMISEAPDAYGVELPPPLLADVNVILRNSRHLASLVDDVLDLSQVEGGQMTISREWVSLPEILDEAAVAVQPLFEAKKLDLHMDIEAEIPPMYCDRTRIRQVLLNLISNAARFTERGGVRVQARREGNNMIVSVSDSGPGIAPEHQQRIFEPFQQVDGSIRRRFGGTGLGLSISKRFVEMHGGRMWLESQVGVGSTFYFSLPVAEAASPVAASALRWLSAEFASRQRVRNYKGPKPHPLPRLVVLEPGAVLQRLLGRYLEGTEIVTVHTFEQAVAELGRSPAQALIVNDPVLGQEGSSLVQQAKHLPFGTPAIACWIPGEEEAAARLGVKRYLLKPISRESLAAALDALGEGIQTILLADDQPEMLQLFGRMLNSAGRGYRVLRAANGQRALELLRERRPDVLVLDLIMPGIDGYTVLREKGADPQIADIPVIAVSALDPVRESIISNSLTLVRGGGLTFRDLLTCMQIWSEAMPQTMLTDDPTRPENRAG